MKKYDPAFSFEYFMGRVQSLLKVLVFSEDMNHCAVYDGETCSEDFKNIVDTQFAGAIGLERFEVKDQYCYVDLKVYMQDIYLKNNDIRKKAKVYKVGLCKNISKPTDYGFSIKKVNCQSCGASFDATKEKYCPYCNSEYHLKDEDWVITYIR